MVENTPFVYSVQVSDPEGKAVTLQVIGGADQELFEGGISSDLILTLMPNFEDPIDANRDNVYEITLEASDGEQRSQLNLKVTVTDAPDSVRLKRVAVDLPEVVSLNAIPGTDDLLVGRKTGQVVRLKPADGTRSTLFTLPAARMNMDVGLIAASAGPRFGLAGRYFVAFLHTDGTLWLESWKPGIFLDYITDVSPMTKSPIKSPADLSGWMSLGPNDELYLVFGDATERYDNIQRVGINPDPYAGVTPNFHIASPNNPDPDHPFVFGYGIRQPVGGTLYQGGFLFVDRFAVRLDGDSVDSHEINRLRKTGDPDTGDMLDFGWGDVFRRSEGSMAQLRSNMKRRPMPALLGGDVYTGTQPLLDGHYILADNQTGGIWSIHASTMAPGQAWELTNLYARKGDFVPDVGTLGPIRAFGKDRAGNVYVADTSGQIFRIEP